MRAGEMGERVVREGEEKKMGEGGGEEKRR